MALRFPTRCKDTTTTTGTGTYTLADSTAAGYRNLTRAVTDGDLADGDTVAYIVVDTSVTGGPKLMEVGTGTWNNTAKTLARTAIYQPNGAAVDWGAGTRDVLITDNPVLFLLLAGGTMTGLLHILLSGSAVTPIAETAAVFQISAAAGTNVNVSIVSGASGIAALNLGDTASQTPGGIRYDNATDTLHLRAGASNRAKITSGGVLQTSASVPYDALPAGTKLLFGNAPPTGWSRVNASEDRLIKLAKSGETEGDAAGSWTVSGLSLSGTTGDHTLAASEIPSHVHSVAAHTHEIELFGSAGGSLAIEAFGKTGAAASTVATLSGGGGNTGAAGSGGAHAHPLDSNGAVASDATWRPRFEIAAWATKN
jgi:hypothetical protein